MIDNSITRTLPVKRQQPLLIWLPVLPGVEQVGPPQPLLQTHTVGTLPLHCDPREQWPFAPQDAGLARSHAFSQPGAIGGPEYNCVVVFTQTVTLWITQAETTAHDVAEQTQPC